MPGEGDTDKKGEVIDKEISKQKSVKTLQGHISHVTRRSRAIDKFMEDRRDHTAVTDNDIDNLKELVVEFKSKFKNMEDKWEAFEFTDALEGEHERCESVFNKAEEMYNKILANTGRFMEWFIPPLPVQSQPIQSTPLQANAPTYAGPPKTNDMLKTKKPLEEKTSLEAALYWFRAYKNHLDLNKGMLAQQTHSVRRGLLEIYIDSHIANNLRAHQDAQDDTPIDGENGCLDNLKNIFMEKNPTWVRRKTWFECVQKDDELVVQWRGGIKSLKLQSNMILNIWSLRSSQCSSS